VIRNPDDKVFSTFFGLAVWIIQDGKKIQSDLMLIFLSENLPVIYSQPIHFP
jgi:hypothetical protein